MLSTLPDGLRLFGSFAVAGCCAASALPWVRRLAVRTSFFDHPIGYKQHFQPTPYLGGAAVLGGFLIAATLFGAGAWSRFAAVTAAALLLFAVGTLDDRV